MDQSNGKEQWNKRKPGKGGNFFPSAFRIRLDFPQTHKPGMHEFTEACGKEIYFLTF